MQKAGKLWIPSDDHFFRRRLEKSGDRFDYESLLACMRYVPKDRRGVAVDVGAHVGTWSVHLAKWFKRVWAIEPQAENFACLNANVKDLDNVSILRMSLGNDVGTMRMLPGSNSGGYFVTTSGAEITNMTRLDSLPITGMDFLKIDVEGYELAALKGGTETIMRDKPVIMIEQNGLATRYGWGYHEAGEYLVDIGYSFREQVNKDYIFTY